MISRMLTLLIFFVMIIFLYLANAQSAYAEFDRGTIRDGRFNTSSIVLDRPFYKSDVYIRKRELQRTTPIKRRVNLYDKHGKKIGYAEKDRTGGINTYNLDGKKTGYYARTLGSPSY